MKGLKRIDSEWVWNVVGILAAIALLLYLLDSFFGISAGPLIPVSGGGESQTVSLPTAALVTPQPSSPTPLPADTDTAPAPTETSSPTTSPTITPTPTASLTPDPFPLVVEGYGPDGRFTLHQLDEGESYTYLAELYDTTVEVLEALNFNKEGKRLWVGQYVVVIPGLEQPPDDLPQFIVLQIEEPADLADLALEYGLTVEELRSYNLLSPNVDSVSMRLLLVPILPEE